MKAKGSATLALCLVIFLALHSYHQIYLSRNVYTITPRQGNIAGILSTSYTATKITCDRTQFHYDACILDGPIVLDPTTSTIHAVGPTNTIEKIRPLPRKWEPHIMSLIKELTLVGAARRAAPACDVCHRSPAIVFSIGGYTGNLFHDFCDGIIPLFITSCHLHFLNKGADNDAVLVISDFHNWWATKYAELLHSLSSHPIVSLDNSTLRHCFPSAIVGLITHGFVSIDPARMPNSETLRSFHAFLDRSYSAAAPMRPPLPPSTRPRLVFTSRKGTMGRVLLNEGEVLGAAKEVGFEVVVFAPSQTTNLMEVYHLVNMSHAMVGVHGAALTHALFLRAGAVMVQVVPLGLEWVSETYFGGPLRKMGVEYMEYKISVEESSLADKYERGDVVLRDPKSLVKRGWNYTDMYLKTQDVRLDMRRFRMYLDEAYKKALRFMQTEG